MAFLDFDQSELLVCSCLYVMNALIGTKSVSLKQINTRVQLINLSIVTSMKIVANSPILRWRILLVEEVIESA